MIISCSCLVFAAVIQVVFGQINDASRRRITHGFQKQSIAAPKHCLSPPPEVNLHKCCPIPRIFSEEEMELCDVQKGQPGQPDFRHKPACLDSKCLMKNADLLLANQSVNYEKMRLFVDKWAEANADFTEAITAAKNVCIMHGEPTGPPICEQDKVLVCLTSTVLWNCNLQDLDGNNGCQTLKEHMDECRPFFNTQSEQEKIESRRTKL